LIRYTIGMVQAELLTETTVPHFRRMASDPNYGFQTKYNGHRLIICKQNGNIRWFNRVGEPSNKPLSIPIRQALLNHPLDTLVIDCELVKTHLYIFDVLALGDELLTNNAYEYREVKYHAAFDDYVDCITPVVTARTLLEKDLLWKREEASQGEGVVAKNMSTPYRQGKSGAHFKLKFWKTADAFVIGPNPDEKDSVEIGMFDANGRVHRISGCSLRNKFHPRIGDVLEIRFLYSTKNHHIVQPTLLHVRTDKTAGQCQLSQLDSLINKNWKRS
jgi:ATP-dependent DNA ligase